MNLQRREEIRMIAECPNDMHWAQEMRRAVAELLAHVDTLEQAAAERVIRDGSRGPTPDYTGEGSAWVPPAVAPAAVVPELTDEDIRREWAALHTGIDGDPDESALSAFEEGVKQGYSLAASRARAIPADRVLGEGMVAVDLAELEALREFHDTYTEDGEYDLDEFLQKMNSVSGKITALRASQGGAAT